MAKISIWSLFDETKHWQQHLEEKHNSFHFRVGQNIKIGCCDFSSKCVRQGDISPKLPGNVVNMRLIVKLRIRWTCRQCTSPAWVKRANIQFLTRNKPNTFGQQLFYQEQMGVLVVSEAQGVKLNHCQLSLLDVHALDQLANGPNSGPQRTVAIY